MNAPNADINGMNKPQYKIPLMVEILKIPFNGYKVISTFSGCGGSCIGYRMAGFQVLWANEFIPIAAKNYQLNHINSYLDMRDIRTINADEILIRTGLDKGECDIFDGSPPCQAFSTAGKREKGWGNKRYYSNKISQQNETLFNDYLRLLQGIMPKVFIAENVSGLIKGKAKGFFLEILNTMKSLGYDVNVRLLDSRWMGIPQSRERIIFIGIRSDLDKSPIFPKPLKYYYTASDVFPLSHFLKDNIQNKSIRILAGNTKFKPIFKSLDNICPTIMAGGPCNTSGKFMVNNHIRSMTIDECKVICSFPSDFKLIGTFSEKWSCLGNSVPPLMMKSIASIIRDKILNTSSIL